VTLWSDILFLAEAGNVDTEGCLHWLIKYCDFPPSPIRIVSNGSLRLLARLKGRVVFLGTAWLDDPVTAGFESSLLLPDSASGQSSDRPCFESDVCFWAILGSLRLA
jgi:hypothetical protein